MTELVTMLHLSITCWQKEAKQLNSTFGLWVLCSLNLVWTKYDVTIVYCLTRFCYQNHGLCTYKSSFIIYFIILFQENVKINTIVTMFSLRITITKNRYLSYQTWAHILFRMIFRWLEKYYNIVRSPDIFANDNKLTQ
jgi:hypothetical protein